MKAWRRQKRDEGVTSEAGTAGLVQEGARHQTSKNVSVSTVFTTKIRQTHNNHLEQKSDDKVWPATAGEWAGNRTGAHILGERGLWKAHMLSLAWHKLSLTEGVRLF